MDLTPTTITGPPNVAFMEADIEHAWDMGSFDFIHGRMLMSAVRDWPALLQRCWDHLEPGGWLELLEVCHPYLAEDPQASSSSSAFLRFGETSARAWEITGRDFYAGTKQAQRLRDLGFQDVSERSFRWPVGRWGSTDRERRIGELNLDNFSNHISSAIELLSYNPGMSEQEGRQLIEDTLEDVTENYAARRFYFDV
ncbi:MAG: hypothetical protein Q9166_004953 [cf. Caloplaca sp. 2 TL-2023]